MGGLGGGGACAPRHLHFDQKPDGVLQADTYIKRVKEHKRSVIGNHVREQHGNEPCEIAKNFRVLRKCSSKFDCLIFEMFFIRDLKPKLSKQSNSIRAKLFA